MAENEQESSGGESELSQPAQSDWAVTDSEPKGRNRRVLARYLAHWRVAMVQPTDDKVRYLGRTDNISLAGACITFDSHVPTLQDYRLYLEIPQEAGLAPLVVECIGRALYSNLAKNVFRVGVKFSQFQGNDERLFDSVLASGKLKMIFDPEND